MSGEPTFPFVCVDVEAEDADAMSGALFELGAQGVEERDATTLVKARVPGKVTLVASFATREEADFAIGELDPALSPAIEVIVGDAWRDAWKEHFRPFVIAPGVVIRPPWEPYTAREGEIVLELEPGRAFGTGLHETTKLVAEALGRGRERLAGATVLDVGTGSGILALLALRLGAARAIAIDVDPDSVAVTRENAVRNGLEARLSASDLDVSGIEGRFPIVLANIEARVLVPMASELGARVAPGGRLLLSGILAGQEEEVAGAYAALGAPAITALGEWVLLAFERPW